MRKIVSAKFITALIFLAMLVFIYRIAGVLFDSRVNDSFIKIFSKISRQYADNRTVLVVIDDKSLDKFPRPKSRDKFIKIFDFLEKKAGAKVIVFNSLIIFPDTYNPDSDTAFFSAVKNSRNIINTYLLINSNIMDDVIPSEYADIFDKTSNITIQDRRTEKRDLSYKGVLNLPKEFLKSVNNLAYANIPADFDDFTREYAPIAMYNGKFYPSLALSAYAMYSGNKEFILTDKYLCSNDGCRSLKMPVKLKKVKDASGTASDALVTYFSWKNPLNKYYSHKSFSASDVLENKIPIEEFKDKIVIIGFNAPVNKREETHSTPVLDFHADIDIHAVMTDNMLENSFKTSSDKNYAAVLTIIFCFLIIRGFKKLRANLIFTSILVLLYIIYYCLQNMLGIYTAIVPPILTMYAAALFKTLYYSAASDKAAETAKHALGKYISKDVLKKVISNLDKLKPGGVRTEAAIFFIDIRNFTKISEELEPSELTEILNEYFSIIAPVIAKYNGIVNKYIGDGLLAVFGEPFSPAEQSKNAVLCGIEIIEKMKVLKEKFKKENKPVINIGIGINTGEVFAGNIGTEERLEYTVIGDNVNLASRIEAYNQILKTQFLISEYTYEYVKDFADVVKLSSVSIKGKSKPIDIYEVLRLKNL